MSSPINVWRHKQPNLAQKLLRIPEEAFERWFDQSLKALLSIFYNQLCPVVICLALVLLQVVICFFIFRQQCEFRAEKQGIKLRFLVILRLEIITLRVSIHFSWCVCAMLLVTFKCLRVLKDPLGTVAWAFSMLFFLDASSWVGKENKANTPAFSTFRFGASKNSRKPVTKDSSTAEQ